MAPRAVLPVLPLLHAVGGFEVLWNSPGLILKVVPGDVPYDPLAPAFIREVKSPFWTPGILSGLTKTH